MIKDILSQIIKNNNHVTANGDIIPISGMTDSHLKNALAYAQKNRNLFYWDMVVPNFIAEIQRRSHEI